MLKTSYPQKATAALLLWLLSFNVFASTLVYQNNGNETTYSETTIGGTGSTTTLSSGADTTLDGAIVQGKRVKADVGGNLTINTPQDVSHYDSKQTSYGVGVSIPLGAGVFGVSGSYSNDKVNANTNTTQEIAGIYAGEGGYDIQVKGNTTLDAGVIASTATPDKNQFTTSTLVLKDKANQSAYDANSVGLSASYSGKQTTTDANGNTVPKMITNDKGEQVQAQGGTVKGFGANLPSTMSASDDASSTTRAAISAGNIRITNDAAQQQLTGQTAEQTISSINHDTANNATLTNLYEQDKESIQTGFAIGKGLSQNFATFMNYMAKDMDSVAKSPAVGKDGKPIIGADGKPMTNQEAYQAGFELGDTINEAGESINFGTRQDLWGSGGTGNRIATALIGAYSGNVSNGASTLLQNTALNVVRTYGATEIKHLADSFSETDDKGNPIPNATSETVRGLLHAIAGCAGASATGGDCASAGLASAGTVAMNNAMTALLNLNPNDMTDTQKQAYSNLIGTLVAGVSTAVGGDAAAAQLASRVEVENNGTASGHLWYPDPIFFILQAKKYQPCYTCQEFGAARLTAQGWSKTPQGKVFGTAWSDTKKKLEIAAIFVPGFRAVTLGMTIGEVVYYVVVEDDMSTAVQATLVGVAGYKFEQLNPYKPSMGISEAQYRSAVEAMKWTFDQGLTGIKNGVNP